MTYELPSENSSDIYTPTLEPTFIQYIDPHNTPTDK